MGNVKWQSVVAVMALTASHARADEWCFVGRQRCEYIGLVEVSLGQQVLTDRDSNKLAVDYAVGVMTKSGFGVTAGARAYDFSPDTHFMVRGRYRSWVGPMMGVDASVAPLLAAGGRPGINLQIAGEYADQIGLYLDFDVVRTNDFNGGSETVIGFGGGVRFSNFAAVPGALLTILAVVVGEDI